LSESRSFDSAAICIFEVCANLRADSSTSYQALSTRSYLPPNVYPIDTP
jgi:hypothetical protein